VRHHQQSTVDVDPIAELSSRRLRLETRVPLPCPDRGVPLFRCPWPVAVLPWRFAKGTILLEARRKLMISNWTWQMELSIWAGSPRLSCSTLIHLVCLTSMTNRYMHVLSNFCLRIFVSIRPFSHHRATAEDIAAAFDGTVWAYKCVGCSGFFLKHSTGISLWREVAQRSAVDTHQQRIASLPVSRRRRDTCNSCYSRRLRAAYPADGDHMSPTNAVSSPPTPSGLGEQSGWPSAIAILGLWCTGLLRAPTLAG